MKKTYIIPSAEAISFEVENMIANSVQNVNGDSGIQLGKGETPSEAGVKTTTVDWEKWD